MIPRHQRTCFSCIYGRLLSDGKTIECYYNVGREWVPSNAFCAHGRWEWLSDRNYLYTIKYADEPMVGFTEKEKMPQGVWMGITKEAVSGGPGLYQWDPNLNGSK